MDKSSENPRKNISITGEDAVLLDKLQDHLNNKLMMKLSTAQIVKRLIRQAAIAEALS